MLFIGGNAIIYFFIEVKTIVNNFPIKKITIPKVGESKPTLNPPAKIDEDIFPLFAEIASKAPKSPITKPKTPNTKANNEIELISLLFFSELSFNAFTKRITITISKINNGTINIGPPSIIKFIILVFRLYAKSICLCK